MNWEEKKNINTRSEEKQKKRKNQRKSKRKGEDRRPKHVVVFVLLLCKLLQPCKIMHKHCALEI
jgi:hypothetical protein